MRGYFFTLIFEGKNRMCPLCGDNMIQYTNLSICNVLSDKMCNLYSAPINIFNYLADHNKYIHIHKMI